MTNDEKVRENRSRWAAARRGYLLTRSLRRDVLAVDFGCYQVRAAQTKRIVFGGRSFQDRRTIGDVEAFLGKQGRH